MSEAAGRKVLFISYDGLTDPLGRSQILPYMQGLSARGHRITILSCDKPDRFRTEAAAVRAICERSGIEWHAIPYRKFLPVVAPVANGLALRSAAFALQRTHRFDIVHCRSYIPAIVGLAMKRKLGVRLIFDMRGFWAEERVEGGGWKLSNPLFRSIYRYFKDREAALLGEADQVVSLTNNAKEEMADRPALAGRSDVVTVIPCCVDFDHFPVRTDEVRARARRELGIPTEASVMVYLGSLGGNYMLDEMFDLFAAYRKRHPGALFLFVTRDDAEMIHSAGRRKGLPDEAVLVRPASRDEVPVFLQSADCGVAFKQPNFSAKACSPTKLGEMLAVGLPVVANRGVGDVEEILASTGAGVVVDRFDPQTLEGAVDALERVRATAPAIRERALSWFSLDDGVSRYDGIYSRLAAAGASAG